MFVAGGLAWGIPLLVASGGLNAYLAALGTQAGEDFTAGEMLYLTRNARAAAFALVRTFVHPWDAPALAAIVLVLAALGIAYLLVRDRRSFAAVAAISVPYLIFHLLFQDTSFVRYALPLVPVVAFLAVRGVALVSAAAVPAVAAVVSIAAVAIASPVLVAYSADAESHGSRVEPDEGGGEERATGRAGDAPDLRASTRSGRGRHRAASARAASPRMARAGEVLEVRTGRTDLVSRRSGAERSGSDRSDEPPRLDGAAMAAGRASGVRRDASVRGALVPDARARLVCRRRVVADARRRRACRG